LSDATILRDVRLALVVFTIGMMSAFATSPVHAQVMAAGDGAKHEEITFSKHIAPILQRSCQNCHRPAGVAPMALTNYGEVRRYARAILRRTSIRDRAGTMPPWYVEKDIGIQHFKDDPSLSDQDLEHIATWVADGTPEGDPADLPPPLVFNDNVAWHAGEPDLIVRSEDLLVAGDAPDWWGDIPSIPTGLTEDRYVASVEIREVNDVASSGEDGRATVGGRFVVHHMIWTTVSRDEDGRASGTLWPVHEVGRNADIFDTNAARLLKAGSSIASNSVHLHSNGTDTKAHLEIGFRFQPVGYEPEYRTTNFSLGNAVDLDIRGMEAGQEVQAFAVLEQHTKIVTFEPHLHAPGSRMCLEAIWGFNVETLSCVGYDHNWVRGYAFADDAQPLLPKGTVLRITGYMDNSADNPNVADPRNWSGAGNRSVSNMFIDLGMRLQLTEEQFVEAMVERRETLGAGVNDHVIGCPLCLAVRVGGGG